MIKLVAGGRDFTNKASLWLYLDRYILPGDSIIHGNANGVDKMAEDYAKAHKIPFEGFDPTWTFGLVGGMSRNQILAYKAEAGICFWNGKSHGTADMIARMKYEGKEIKVVYYK